MAVNRGLLVLLEAKAGKEGELAAFLQSGRELALAEEGTVTWYAFQVNENTYGIFDTFENEEGRQAHLSGEIAKALGQIAPEMLAKDPDIRPVDVIAAT
ncbi:MAG TPA: antibiotic biosynthesis monooxygenase [Pseudonocardiaceae bacterium]|nr:antibiotic biosynthesis monooxygenase [Pseudonocardiaceae bacterium]